MPQVVSPSGWFALWVKKAAGLKGKTVKVMFLVLLHRLWCGMLPFCTFHASHLALPAMLNIPGRSVDVKAAMTVRASEQIYSIVILYLFKLSNHTATVLQTTGSPQKMCPSLWMENNKQLCINLSLWTSLPLWHNLSDLIFALTTPYWLFFLCSSARTEPRTHHFLINSTVLKKNKKL